MKITIPIKKGTNLGYVKIYQGKTLVGKVDLVNTKRYTKGKLFKNVTTSYR